MQLHQCTNRVLQSQQLVQAVQKYHVSLLACESDSDQRIEAVNFENGVFLDKQDCDLLIIIAETPPKIGPAGNGFSDICLLRAESTILAAINTTLIANTVRNICSGIKLAAKPLTSAPKATPDITHGAITQGTLSFL